MTKISSSNSSDDLASCLVALGSNVGRREQTLDDALQELDRLPATSVVSRSAWHRSRPVGGPAGQGEFLNAAAVIRTGLAPESLLGELLAIETRLGRVRGDLWAERTLDLDLLLVDEMVIDTPQLTLPHPRMSYRPFVLAPAVEVAASWRHPLLDATLDDLWWQLCGGNDCVLIYGGAAADRQWHAEQLTARFRDLRLIEVGSTAADSTWGLWLAAGKGTVPMPGSPKLAIQLLAGTEPPLPGLPTITLPADGRDEVLYETIAAVEGVSIDLGHAATGE